MKFNLTIYFRLAVTLTMLFLAMPSFAGDRLDKITNENELTYFTQTYYLHPQPELISQAIEYIGSSGLLTKYENAIAPTTAFFSKLFSDNPSSVDSWKELIAKQDPKTRETMQVAIEKSPEQLAKQEDDGSTQNDIFWGAFFASGNKAYLDKIVSQLKFQDERKNLNLFLAAASAKWSLSSNSQSHLAVRAVLENFRRGDDLKMRLVAEEILTKSPGQIQDETRAIVIKQKENGGWQ